MSNALLTEVRKLRSEAHAIHQRLEDLQQIPGGTKSAANNLVKRLDSAIAFLERGGDTEMDPLERLARNAWRMHVAATDPVFGDELPAIEDWQRVPKPEQARWRAAAAAFKAKPTPAEED